MGQGTGNNPAKKCYFCKEPMPPLYTMAEVVQWNEVHSPYWAPAHRKCCDGCETVACEVLALMYRETPEGLDPVPVKPEGQGLEE